MEFPYSWQCQYSKKSQGPFTICQCTIFPLYLVIQFHNQKKVLNINSTKFNNQNLKQSQTSKILYLVCGKQIYYFRCLSKIDYNIIEKAFSYIFPLGEYQNYYHKENLADSLCVKDIDIYYCQNIRFKTKHLVRSINMSKKDAMNQLEIIRVLNVKTAFKPVQLYLQNHLFKLVYRYISGTNLKKQLKKKKKYEEDQLSIFIKKMLFFIQHLETNHVYLPILKEELIILQGDSISDPYIYDFSEAVIVTDLWNQKKKPIFKNSNSVQQLGKIFYKLIKFQDYQEKDFQKIRPNFREQNLGNFKNKTQYHKSMYQLMQKMLSSPKNEYGASDALKHIWFKQVKDQGSNNLSTIVSLYSREQRSANVLEFDEQEWDIFNDTQISIQKEMQKHLNNIQQPFSFMKCKKQVI